MARKTIKTIDTPKLKNAFDALKAEYIALAQQSAGLTPEQEVQLGTIPVTDYAAMASQVAQFQRQNTAHLTSKFETDAYKFETEQVDALYSMVDSFNTLASAEEKLTDADVESLTAEEQQGIRLGTRKITEFFQLGGITAATPATPAAMEGMEEIPMGAPAQIGIMTPQEKAAFAGKQAVTLVGSPATQPQQLASPHNANVAGEAEVIL